MIVSVVFLILIMVSLVQSALLIIVYLRRDKKDVVLKHTVTASILLFLALLTYLTAPNSTFDLSFTSMVFGFWTMIFIIKALEAQYEVKTKLTYVNAIIITSVLLITSFILNLNDLFYIQTIVSSTINSLLALYILIIVMNNSTYIKSAMYYEIILYVAAQLTRIFYAIYEPSATPDTLPLSIIMAFTLSIFVIVLIIISIVAELVRFDFLMLENARETIERSYKVAKKFNETDQLTGLYNRSRLSELIDLFIERKQGFMFDFSIIITDIADYKKIIQTQGQETVDKITQLVGENIKQAFRLEDYVGRWSEDQFLVILPKTNEENTKFVIGKLEKALQNLTLEGFEGKIELNYGYCFYTEELDKNALIQSAFDSLLK